VPCPTRVGTVGRRRAGRARRLVAAASSRGRATNSSAWFDAVSRPTTR
jgi:hypothetical protein